MVSRSVVGCVRSLVVLVCWVVRKSAALCKCRQNLSAPVNLVVKQFFMIVGKL